MKFSTKVLAIGMTMFAGIALAEGDATDPMVIAQKDLMKSFGGAAKTLGGMAAGEVPFDAVAAAAAKEVLIAGSADIAVKFATAGTDPASESSPTIWTSWDAFLVKAGDLNTAATTLDVASVETIGAGMGAIGGACKACHMEYRVKK